MHSGRRDGQNHANNEQTKQRKQSKILNEFWKQSKRLLNKGQHELYDTITEDSTKLENPEEAKTHIRKYFKDLYQAQPGKLEYEQWTEHIQQNVKETNKQMDELPDPCPITTKEIKQATKQLKQGKSMGPDNIPNEAIIEANQTVLEIYKAELNKIIKNRTPPLQWQKGLIRRLYKGKGIKGKCSCKRGMILASNVGKLYERILNNRISKEVDISEAQAGGQEGKAITDHLLILKDLLKDAQNKRKTSYVAFLNVTKAYDKA